MILDRIENARKYEAAFPGIEKSAAAAAEIPAAEIFQGREPVFPTVGARINFGEFETSPVPETLRYEAHRENTDVMILASGSEKIYFADLSDLKVTDEYSAPSDVLFGNADEPAGFVVLRPGFFAIFTPNDAHAPGLEADGLPCRVKKLVIKLKNR